MMIAKDLSEQLFDHCRRDFPHEACGIIAGKDDRAERIFPMKNISSTPRTFYEMEPAEQFKVIKKIRSLGLTLLGIYHSHVASQAYPSEKDRNLAFYPDAVYLIVSMLNFAAPEIKGFKINDGHVSTADIIVE